MKTIYKYPLDIGTSRFDAPPLFTPLYVGLDPSGQVCLWAEVENNDDPWCQLTVTMVGTGNVVNPEMKYVGTFIRGSFVWHVYYAHGPY